MYLVQCNKAFLLIDLSNQHTPCIAKFRDFSTKGIPIVDTEEYCVK